MRLSKFLTPYPLPPDMKANHRIRVQVGTTQQPFQIASAGDFTIASARGILISSELKDQSSKLQLKSFQVRIVSGF